MNKEQQREYPAVIVVTTTSGKEEAGAIARAAVGRRLAACVHIDRICSVYFWEGAVQEDTEYRLLMKTTEAACNALTDLIAEMHSYEVPGIYCLPIVGGNESYLDWVRENTGGIGAGMERP